MARTYGYDVDSAYLPDAFQKPLRDASFSIPLKAATARICFPDSLRTLAEKLRDRLKAGGGEALPLLSESEARTTDFSGLDLIVAGSFGNHPLMAVLYKKRYAFFDAAYPGKGGYAVHSVPSAFDPDRFMLLIGGDREEEIRAGVEKLMASLPSSCPALPFTRIVKTRLEQPAPPSRDWLDAHFKRVIENPAGTSYSYSDMADWLLTSFLWDSGEHADAFMASVRAMAARARRYGCWVTEKWTFTYFFFSHVFMSWQLLQCDPRFIKEDRRDVIELLWAMALFFSRVPYLKEEYCPPEEIRQNHTTFLALSLYYGHRYFKWNYGIRDLDWTEEAYRRCFDGQKRSFRPNDNAGGYVALAPAYAFCFWMAELDHSFVASGNLKRLADLMIALTDNDRRAVGYGDVHGYAPGLPEPSHLNYLDNLFVSAAAAFHADPQYRWYLKWRDTGARLAPKILQLGLYATEGAAEPPARFSGCIAIPADAATLEWSAARTKCTSHLPQPRTTYLEKLVFRAGFSDRDEYAILDGLSTLAHGHQNGNTFLQLSARGRIWLCDTEYIKHTPRYHNGLLIARDGEAQDPPPLTELLFARDSGTLGFSATRSRDFSGADWTRFVVWRKNGFFLVIDNVKASLPGEYRIESRFHTRGEVRLDGNRFTARQGDAAMTVISADLAQKSLEIDPDTSKGNWEKYPFKSIVDGCEQAAMVNLLSLDRCFMNSGEAFTFSALLSIHDSGAAPAFDLASSGENGWLVRSGASAELVALDDACLRAVGIEAEFDLMHLDNETLHLFGLRSMSGQGVKFSSAEPVELELHFNGNAAALPAGMTALTPAFFEALSGLLPRAQAECPAATPVPGRPVSTAFGFLKPVKIQAPESLTALWCDERGFFAAGARGGVYRHDGESLAPLFTVPGGAVDCLLAGDITGDGSTFFAAGSADEKIRVLDPQGRVLREHAMSSFYDPDRPRVREFRLSKGLGDAKGPWLLAATTGWQVYAFDSAGAQKLNAYVKYHPLTRVRVLEEPGRDPLIVAGNVYSTPINVLDRDGAILWHAWEQVGSECKSRTEYMGIELTDLAFADVDNDGRMEIVFGTKYNRVYAVKADDGRLVWSANVGAEVVALHPVPEGFMTVTTAGDLVLLGKEGARKGSLSLSAPIKTSRVMTGPEGRTEAVVLLADGGVAVIDENLRLRAFAPKAAEQPQDAVLFRNKDGKWLVAAIGEKAIAVFPYPRHSRRESRFY